MLPIPKLSTLGLVPKLGNESLCLWKRHFTSLISQRGQKHLLAEVVYSLIKACILRIKLRVGVVSRRKVLTSGECEIKPDFAHIKMNKIIQNITVNF